LKKIFFFLSIFLLSANAFSQDLIPNDAPTLICVEESGLSDNRIEWINNHNCGPNFVATNIYEATDINGPYVKTSVFNSSQVLQVKQSPNPDVEVFYYLETECAAGTGGFVSDTISTFIHPSPNIRSASVIGETVRITWDGIDRSDVGGYYIYKIAAQGPILIDSVSVDMLPIGATPELPFFDDVFADPKNQSEEYSITVFDRCNNRNSSPAISTVTSHETMLLEAEYDSCTSVINLSWNHYAAWDSIERYELTKEFNPSPFETVDGNTSSYQYTIKGDDPNPLVFTVKAIKGSGFGAGIESSNSNEIEVTIGISALPAFIKMRNVSVVNENEIRIDWIYDATGTANSMFINRGNDPSNITNVINQGPLNVNSPLLGIDNTVNTSKESYYYSLSAENGCGIAVESDTARTIHLNGQDNFDLSNVLTWNKFELKDATVLQYILQRKENGSLVELEIFGPNDALEYIDDVSNVDPEDGAYCYRVDCKFELQLPLLTDSNNSFSNEVCINQTSRIFVPTAFSPNGVNKVFKPVFVYPNDDNYSLVVFTKWGEKVFESNDPDIGWDGTHDGELAPQGVYAYMIQMQSTNGNTLPRKGTVLLIR